MADPVENTMANSIAGVDGESVCCVSDEQHFLSVAAKFFHQAGGQAVIMIRAGRLDVSVVLVKAEVDETRSGFVIPFVLAVPEFACARLERHAVERYTEPAAASKCRPGGTPAIFSERVAVEGPRSGLSGWNVLVGAAGAAGAGYIIQPAVM